MIPAVKDYAIKHLLHSVQKKIVVLGMVVCNSMMLSLIRIPVLPANVTNISIIINQMAFNNGYCLQFTDKVHNLFYVMNY